MSRYSGRANPFGVGVLVVLLLAAAVLSYMAVDRTNADSAGAEALDFSTPDSTASVEETASPEAPFDTVSLWIGDSFTAGTGATSKDQAESCLTAAAMNWVCARDAQGGTGFVADGKSNFRDFTALSDRLAGTVAANPDVDVVLIDAGRNDGRVAWDELEPAAADYFADVREAYPDAALVAIVPYYMNGNSRAEFGEFAVEEMDELGGYVIDPVGEGWISSATGDLVIADNTHPSPEGHEYIAENLERRLLELGIPRGNAN